MVRDLLRFVEVVAGCPRMECANRSPRPKSVPFGRYYRTSDRHWISRFRCHGCRRTYSSATGHPAFGQKKRQINEDVRFLLASGNSMRRIARYLSVHRITVARKLRFLGAQARGALTDYCRSRSDLPGFQFDELETFEHTKYKPLSVVMAVLPEERKILGFEVASMPAKGLLAARGRRKYGPRPDQRGQALANLFRALRPHMAPRAFLRSDANPHYHKYVRRFFPDSTHVAEPGARGCVVGQGELKALRFDPLFSLNHTFAMLRANVNRLIRRTWCTTKKPQALSDHIALYADFHNQTLTGPSRMNPPSL